MKHGNYFHALVFLSLETGRTSDFSRTTFFRKLKLIGFGELKIFR